MASSWLRPVTPIIRNWPPSKDQIPGPAENEVANANRLRDFSDLSDVPGITLNMRHRRAQAEFLKRCRKLAGGQAEEWLLVQGFTPRPNSSTS